MSGKKSGPEFIRVNLSGGRSDILDERPDVITPEKLKLLQNGDIEMGPPVSWSNPFTKIIQFIKRDSLDGKRSVTTGINFSNPDDLDKGDGVGR